MAEQELRKKAIASMDNCYLEIGTQYKGIVQKQAIPPALREKIYDQILALIKEAGYKSPEELASFLSSIAEDTIKKAREGYVKMAADNVPPSLWLAIRDARWDYIKISWR